MAGRNRWLVFAFLAIVIAIAGGIAMFSGGEEPGVSPTSRLAADDEDGRTDEDSGSAASGTSADTLTPTEEAATSPAKPKVKDKPAPPSANPPAPGEQPDTAWQEYIEETREVVETNEASLTEAITAITDAIRSGDADLLSGMVAPDEGSPDAFATDLANTYPEILTTDPGANVNVYTDGQATIYIAYVLVKWQDAGLASEHTIPIMLRYVDGEWCLTTLGEAGADMQFVQSVTL